MEEWRFLSICVLLLLNFLSKPIDWFFQSRKPQPMTLLQYLKAQDIISSGSSLSKEEIESIVERSEQEVKNFIALETRRAEKRKYDNEKGFNKEGYEED